MFASLTVLVVNLLREIAYPILSIISDQNLDDRTYAIDKSFLLFVFFILIIFTHRKNISNLKNKTEQKIKI